ncbi:hypothetical protein Tsubulata_034470 [Turnera subulata]|uniref:Thioredoxin-like fold domain-containing protein n=1 Tax=Turnera subulata TaxID=218843 RepID=A0A9Q0F1C3_9ROSI|nr:hypothetical protein Tsubulata_034470 [Turnera subulata]
MAPRLFACFGKSRDASSSSADANNSSGGGKSNVTDASAEEQRRGGAVMVELFSSQGCKTSPEAELLVSRLGRGDFNLEVPVTLLVFHVDIWDYMGWKDPYGSTLCTVRQKAYVEALKLDTMFTPQIVVQGATQFVGNDEEALLAAIADAHRFPSPTFQATFEQPTTDFLQVTLSGALRTKIDKDGADVMVALYESGLVTDCPAGENKGRVLSNDYVVRKLEKLCTVKDISAKKTVSGTVNFSLWEGFNSSKCGIAIFVQDSSHKILGSQTIQFPNNI